MSEQQKPGSPLTARDIALMIDHSLLNPAMALNDLMAGFELAKQYGVSTCCVRPMDVALAARELEGSGVGVCPVIGFPHGSHTTEVKVFEAQKAIDDGGPELDMVLAIGRLKSGDYGYVERDIVAVVEAAHARTDAAIVKVILECFYLTDEEKVKACQICERAGADYVKTSTGYAGGGATIEDVKLMRRTCSPRVAIKAAGGIRTLDVLLQFRAAGARKIGASATKIIMEEALKREKEGTLAEVAI
jgi:deoxyribose-phosphate aldolase